MRVVCLHQGDAEWIEARLGVATASNMGRIMSTLKRASNGKKAGDPSQDYENYVREVATEILTGVPKEHYVTPAMDRGRELEPEARKYYAQVNRVKVSETGFVLHPTKDYLGASPDLLRADHNGAEIKCLLPDTHTDYLMLDALREDGALKDEKDYFWQVHTEILCCEWEWCDFFLYCPIMKAPALRHKQMRIYRNEELCRRIEDAADLFWERVCDRVAATFRGVEADPAMSIPQLVGTGAALSLPAPEKELSTTAYMLGRSHTCPKCETSNIPCTERAPSTGDLNARLKASIKRESPNQEGEEDIDVLWDEAIEKPMAAKKLTFPAKSGNWEKVF